jgi:hypothetical protein
MNGLVEQMRKCSIQDKKKRDLHTYTFEMEEFFADLNYYEEQNEMAKQIEELEKKRNEENDWTIWNLPPVKIVTRVSFLRFFFY